MVSCSKTCFKVKWSILCEGESRTGSLESKPGQRCVHCICSSSVEKGRLDTNWKSILVKEKVIVG